MSALRKVYHLMRADLFERARRYSFLITLGFVVFAAYLYLPPKEASYLTLGLGHYRGVYNSAWVGAAMAVLCSALLSLPAFFLVKNAIERDERTRVGQIIATTPLSKSLYTLGKAFSNFVFLAAMVGVIALAAGGMQLARGEVLRLDPWPLLAPFIVCVLPAMAMIAALAILFETIPWLAGTLGNVIYCLLWLGVLIATAAGVPADPRQIAGPANDVWGVQVIVSGMMQDAAVAFPNYAGLISIGGATLTAPLETFTWQGIRWSSGVILGRLTWLAAAIGLSLIAALFFRRFDPAPLRRGRPQQAGETISPQPGKPERGEVTASAAAIQGFQMCAEHPERSSRFVAAESKDAGFVPQLRHPSTAFRPHYSRNSAQDACALPLRVEFLAAIRLSPLAASSRPRLAALLAAETRLMLKGTRWWWFVGALGLIIAGLLAPSDATRYILPVAWLWPLAIWSSLGCREARHDARQLVFSAPRQLPALWLAGILLALVTGSGVAAHLVLTGEWTRLLAWGTGALFIPTLALALGAWNGSSKLFEVVYMIWWYAGPVNRVPALDFMGTSEQVSPATLAPFWIGTTILLGLAVLGRRRQAKRD